MDLDHLKRKNPVSHIDDRITFHAGFHKYYIDGEEYPNSVTALVGDYCGKFDADQVIQKMRNGRNWNEENKYYGMSDDQIKKQWDHKKVEAANMGTRLHESIEVFYNQKDQIRDDQNEMQSFKEFEQFLEYHKHHVENKLIPWRTEWRVFDEEYRIAGSVDMLYEYEKHENMQNDQNDEHVQKKNNKKDLVLADWKRTEEISRENRWSNLLPPLDYLSDCSFHRYSLQLNVYKWIIEKNSNYFIKEMFLVRFHPLSERYEKVHVPVLTNEIEAIMTSHLSKRIWDPVGGRLLLKCMAKNPQFHLKVVSLQKDDPTIQKFWVFLQNISHMDRISWCTITSRLNNINSVVSNEKLLSKNESVSIIDEEKNEVEMDKMMSGQKRLHLDLGF